MRSSPENPCVRSRNAHANAGNACLNRMSSGDAALRWRGCPPPGVPVGRR